MTHSGHVFHHFHIRKRIHEKSEKFPSPDKKVRFLDNIIYIVGVLGPVMTLPQIIKIFFFQNAAGVSLITYIALTLFSCVWLLYGIVHKEKPIIVTNILWIFSEVLIVIWVVLYGKGFL